jgi:hypothetical protein
MTLQRGHRSASPAEKTTVYPMIALHFGHRIPMYNRRLPALNKAIAPYNIDLKILGCRKFSMKANTINAAKPIATNIKYKFFRSFIFFIGFIVSFFGRYHEPIGNVR